MSVLVLGGMVSILPDHNSTITHCRYGHQVDNVFRLAKYQSLLQVID